MELAQIYYIPRIGSPIDPPKISLKTFRLLESPGLFFSPYLLGIVTSWATHCRHAGSQRWRVVHVGGAVLSTYGSLGRWEAVGTVACWIHCLLLPGNWVKINTQIWTHLFFELGSTPDKWEIDVNVMYFFGIIFEKDGFWGNYISLPEAETKTSPVHGTKSTLVRWYLLIKLMIKSNRMGTNRNLQTPRGF